MHVDELRVVLEVERGPPAQAKDLAPACLKLAGSSPLSACFPVLHQFDKKFFLKERYANRIDYLYIYRYMY